MMALLVPQCAVLKVVFVIVSMQTTAVTGITFLAASVRCEGTVVIRLALGQSVINLLWSDTAIPVLHPEWQNRESEHYVVSVLTVCSVGCNKVMDQHSRTSQRGSCFGSVYRSSCVADLLV